MVEHRIERVFLEPRRMVRRSRAGAHLLDKDAIAQALGRGDFFLGLGEANLEALGIELHVRPCQHRRDLPRSGQEDHPC